MIACSIGTLCTHTHTLSLSLSPYLPLLVPSLSLYMYRLTSKPHTRKPTYMFCMCMYCMHLCMCMYVCVYLER